MTSVLHHPPLKLHKNEQPDINTDEIKLGLVIHRVGIT